MKKYLLLLVLLPAAIFAQDTIKSVETTPDGRLVLTKTINFKDSLIKGMYTILGVPIDATLHNSISTSVIYTLAPNVNIEKAKVSLLTGKEVVQDSLLLFQLNIPVFITYVSYIHIQGNHLTLKEKTWDVSMHMTYSVIGFSIFIGFIFFISARFFNERVLVFVPSIIGIIFGGIAILDCIISPINISLFDLFLSILFWISISVFLYMCICLGNWFKEKTYKNKAVPIITPSAGI